MRDGAVSSGVRVLPPNDPRQYDDLAGEWWRPDGAFAMLHWLARARAALVPPAARPDAVLVDLGCGAGLMAPTWPAGATATSGWTSPGPPWCRRRRTG